LRIHFQFLDWLYQIWYKQAFVKKGFTNNDFTYDIVALLLGTQGIQCSIYAADVGVFLAGIVLHWTDMTGLIRVKLNYYANIIIQSIVVL
jgi:hypothetical protein